MEQNSRKIYYSMGEVSEMMDVSPSLLRFWEKRFDVIKPHKNKKGNRMFTPADVENLKLIYHLVKEKGMTLDGAAKVLKKDKAGLSRDTELIERLMTVRSLLAEIRQELYEDDPQATTIVVENDVMPETKVVVQPVSAAKPVQPVAVCEPAPEPIAVKGAGSELPDSVASWGDPGGMDDLAARRIADAAGAAAAALNQTGATVSAEPGADPAVCGDTATEKPVPRIIEQTLF